MKGERVESVLRLKIDVQYFLDQPPRVLPCILEMKVV